MKRITTKKVYISFCALISILLILSSCKTDSSLTDSGLVQKRRYQKGYHFNLKSDKEKKTNKESLSKSHSEPPLIASTDESVSLNQPLAPKELKTPTETKRISKAEIKAPRKQSIKSEENQNKFDSRKQNAKVRDHSSGPDYYDPATRKVNSLALLSFLFALVSLFVAGIPLGAAAVVLGIIGLSKIEKNPEIYKGKGFAIVGIIVGLISILVVAAALSAM